MSFCRFSVAFAVLFSFLAVPALSAPAAESLPLSALYKGKETIYHGIADRDRCPDYTPDELALVRSRADARARSLCRRSGHARCELVLLAFTPSCRQCSFTGPQCTAKAFVQGSN